jgi:hypothetical protein
MLNSQRWRRLIPVASVTCSFAYLDRSDCSIGAAGGLTSRLHITAAQAGFLGGLFFLDVGRARRGASAVPFVFLAACLFAAALLAGSAW